MRQLCCKSLVADYYNPSGDSFSGKTTIFNHLQILYGNGITRIERLTAFECIIRQLIDAFMWAWSVWRDEDGHLDQESCKEVCNTVIVHAFCQNVTDCA